MRKLKKLEIGKKPLVETELYNAPRGSKVIVLEEGQVPPAAAEIKQNDIITFHHIDGMYSLCHNAAGEIVHLAAWTKVAVVK